MILLWGLLEDGTMRSVHDRLVAMNADVYFVNHAEIDRSAIEFISSPQPSYCLSYRGNQTDFSEFRSAYLRPYNFRDYPQFGDEEESSDRARSADLFHHLIHSWAEHTDARIINKPSAEATNHSKLFQSIYISESGFLIPDSLISNDAEEILAFSKAHTSIIYKSMSSIRSIVKEFSPGDLVGHEEMGPVFFQRRIIGKNIRVHVVGEEVFACEIESEGIDYRYAKSRMTPIELPEDIASASTGLAKRLGLLVAGIDLIVTPEGQWYCLEANPSPGFSYYDIFPERSIAQAVAEALYI
ncbi:MAG: hypothetical protein Q8919_09955 [Bacteroidota bacterium]|nr:hypothetical protein [Bacteroidota bacterium]